MAAMHKDAGRLAADRRSLINSAASDESGAPRRTAGSLASLMYCASAVAHFETAGFCSPYSGAGSCRL